MTEYGFWPPARNAAAPDRRTFPKLRLRDAISGKSNWERVLGKSPLMALSARSAPAAFPSQVPFREGLAKTIKKRQGNNAAEEAMQIENLNHVQLAMPAGEEDAARRFYADVLGIPEVVKPAHLAERGGCWFERGALKVHLGVETDFRPAKKAHPAFKVTDLPALIARIETAGFSVVDDEPLEGYDRRYVTDPFGNRIELMEPV